MKLVRFASGGRKGVGVVTGDGVVEVGAALRSEGNVDVGEGAYVTPLLALGSAGIELLRATVESGGAATLSRDAGFPTARSRTCRASRKAWRSIAVPSAVTGSGTPQ
jgi:hypothetical protein